MHALTRQLKYLADATDPSHLAKLKAEMDAATQEATKATNKANDEIAVWEATGAKADAANKAHKEATDSVQYYTGLATEKRNARHRAKKAYEAALASK